MRKLLVTTIVLLLPAAALAKPVHLPDAHQLLAATVTTSSIQREYLAGKRDRQAAVVRLHQAYDPKAAQAAPSTPPAPPTSLTTLKAKTDADWKVLKVGAGGYITGIDIAADGTKLARTDTYGMYLWEGGDWRQLVTKASMPAGKRAASAAYEAVIAPSQTSTFYALLADGFYRSRNRGKMWQQLPFPVNEFNPNGANRMDGQKMAVHPTDPLTVLAGTQEKGLFLTRDGGDSWAKIDAVPAGPLTEDPGLTGIVWSGDIAFVGTAGSGVYHSTDKAMTWKAIGGPAALSHATVSPDGSYYATGQVDHRLWKYTGGAWSNLTEAAHAVAVDPFNPNRVVLLDDGGNLQSSLDGGKTWGEGRNWGKQIAAVDIPWLKDSGLYMSTGGLRFDPAVKGKVWQSAGVGVWTSQLPDVIGWQTPIVWQSVSKGIEQLVANQMVATSAGDVALASWDRPVFSITDPDTYPTTYAPPGFNMAWDIDYASSDPRTLVSIINYWGKEQQSGISTDGGKTWQKFAAAPSGASGTIGGQIAASTPLNIIWLPAQNKRPAYTLDGGKTWTDVTIPGVTDYSGLHGGGYFLVRHTLAADRVTPNVFYLYDSATPGVWRTQDGGKTWAKVFSGQVTDWSVWNAQLLAMPSSAGELWFTSGPQGGGVPTAIDLKHSTNGGRSWRAIPNAKAMALGFGAPLGAGQPAVLYMWGFLNDKRGVWGSPDRGKTWTLLAENPLGSLDNIKTISGDMARPGRVYVGFGGSGWAYLNAL